MTFAIVAVLLCCAASTPQEFEQRVLVVGAADSERAGEYADFLDDHFAAVERIDAAAFTATSAHAFDVVVVESGGPLALPRDWNRACVTIGLDALCTIDGLASKLTYGGQAATAFAVREGLEPESLRSAHVEASTVLEPAPSPVRWCWVANEPIASHYAAIDTAGFLDSPDCEILVSALSAEGRPVGLVARHAHIVHWGDERLPSTLSAPGRRALVETIAFAARHDRQPRLVRRVAVSRDAFDTRLARVGDAGLSEADTAFFGKPLVDLLGSDVAAYRAWIEAHRPHVLWSRERGFEIDVDAQTLGIDNRSVDALFTCADELAGDDAERAARALSFLRRATGQDFATSDEWLAWLEPREERLFHSDVGGYRFFEVPHPPGPIEPPDPGAQKVAFTANLVEDEEGLAIVVRVRLAEGWHLYDRVAPSSAYRPTTLRAELPATLTSDAPWQRPPAKPSTSERGTTLIEGNVHFRLPVALVGELAAADLGSIAIAYQVCDARLCLAPKEVHVEVVDRR